MLTIILGILCLIFAYLIVAIFYNWKENASGELRNIRFILIALYNAILAIYAFPKNIQGLIFFIHSTDENEKLIFPLAKYYYFDWGAQDPRPDWLMFSLTYILLGTVLLYLPTKLISGIKSYWKCVLMTILLTVIPVLIFNLSRLFS